MVTSIYFVTFIFISNLDNLQTNEAQEPPKVSAPTATTSEITEPTDLVPDHDQNDPPVINTDHVNSTVLCTDDGMKEAGQGNDGEVQGAVGADQNSIVPEQSMVPGARKTLASERALNNASCLYQDIPSFIPASSGSCLQETNAVLSAGQPGNEMTSLSIDGQSVDLSSIFSPDSQAWINEQIDNIQENIGAYKGETSGETCVQPIGQRSMDIKTKTTSEAGSDGAVKGIQLPETGPQELDESSQLASHHSAEPPAPAAAFQQESAHLTTTLITSLTSTDCENNASIPSHQQSTEHRTNSSRSHLIASPDSQEMLNENPSKFKINYIQCHNIICKMFYQHPSSTHHPSMHASVVLMNAGKLTDLWKI